VPTPIRQLVAPTLSSLWRSTSTDDVLLLKLDFPPELRRDYGAPASADVTLTFPNITEPTPQDVVMVELTLLDKAPTRLGEAAFFTLNPAGKGSWWMDKQVPTRIIGFALRVMRRSCHVKRLMRDRWLLPTGWARRSLRLRLWTGDRGGCTASLPE